MAENIDDLAQEHLGDRGTYAITTDTYDPSFLVALPRTEVREENGIGRQFGYDAWHAYESTFLLDNGAPVTGTLKIVYPSSGELMVESKSLKLYLNTFDMCKLGKTVTQAKDMYISIVKNHLEELLNTEVLVSFHWIGSGTQTLFYDYDYLDTEIDIANLEGPFVYDAENFEVEISRNMEIDLETAPSKTYLLYTNSLRSRCRVTAQKDSGSVYFYIKVSPGFELNKESLYRLIISLREKEEFHEPCCELLLQNIVNSAAVEEASVTALYSRRGGIDICPTRATKKELLPVPLCNSFSLTAKALGQ